MSCLLAAALLFQSRFFLLQVLLLKRFLIKKKKYNCEKDELKKKLYVFQLGNRILFSRPTAYIPDSPLS